MSARGPTAAPDASSARGTRFPGTAALLGALVAGAATAGVALRIWVLTSSPGTLDGDEAVWGLMARHLLDGELAAFYWGQGYGGTQEVFLTAPLVALFGLGTVTIRVVPIALWALAAVLVWRVGLHTLGEPRARIAAALFWVSSSYFLWKSTRAHGFYGSTLVLGLAIVLLALRLRERASRRDLVLLGLALGCGWWASPQIVVLALPALAWLVWQRPQLVRGAWPVLPGLVAGALPWLIANVRHEWLSLDAANTEGSRLGHLHNLASATLPTALGLRVPFSLAWLGGVQVGVALYLLALAAFALLCLRRDPRTRLLALVLVAFPLFYLVSPYTWLTTEARYLVLLSPVLALAIASVLTGPWRAALVLAVALTLAAAGVAAIARDDLAAIPAEGKTVPRETGPLRRLLALHGVRHAYANYWVAWRLVFETDERLIVATSNWRHATARAGRVDPDDEEPGRYPRFYRQVQRDRDAAHILLAGGEVEAEVRPLLEQTGYRRLQSGGFAVYLAPGS